MVTALVLPLAFFPLLSGFVFGADSFMGDGLMVHQFSYDSRRYLAAVICRDWIESLPAGYGFVAVLWGLEVLMDRFSRCPMTLTRDALAGGISGAIMSVSLCRIFHWQVFLFFLTGMILSCARHFFIPKKYQKIGITIHAD